MERRLRKLLPGGKFVEVPDRRAKTMAAIRGKHTQTTELRLRMAFVRAGIRGWRTNVGDLPGKPDFYFPEKRLAVFVDGCFWHGCPRCGHYPQTRQAFWKAKIRRNRERDRQQTKGLRENGIQVIRLWEHVLRDSQALERRIARIQYELQPGAIEQQLSKRRRRVWQRV